MTAFPRLWTPNEFSQRLQGDVESSTPTNGERYLREGEVPPQAVLS